MTVRFKVKIPKWFGLRAYVIIVTDTHSFRFPTMWRWHADLVYTNLRVD